MKSIREWMVEHGIGEDNIENIDLIRLLGSSSVKINRKLAMKLHPKLQQVLSDPEFAEEDPSELLRQVIAVAAKEVSGSSGTTLSVPRVTHGLADGEHVARETT